MRKMKGIAAGLCAICFGAGIALHAGTNVISQAASVSNVSDFIETSDFDVEHNVKGSEIAIGDGTTPFSNDKKSGVKFTGKKNGSSAVGSTVTFTQEFSGLSEFDFRVYSETSYTNLKEDGTEKPGGIWGMYAQNTELDLREIAFTFTDVDTEESFTVYIAGGQDSANTYVAMRVGLGAVNANEGAGLNYSNDSVTGGVYRQKGYNGFNTSYNTSLRGATFSNTLVSEYSGAREIAPYSKSTAFGFDPASMEIYGYTYGIKLSNTQKILVADLKDEENMHYHGGTKALDSFENYTVTVTVTDVTAGRTPKFVLYSVNGQSLAGANGRLQDNAGPSPTADVQARAISGSAYKLPNLKAFDALEGEIAYKGNVKVMQGNNVLLAEQPYQEGLTFTPNGTEDCKLILSGAIDSKNNTFNKIDGSLLETTYTIEVLDSVPTMTVQDYAQETWLYGKLAPIGAKCASDLYYKDAQPSIKLVVKTLTGETMATVADVDESTAYEFEQAGEYQLCYQATDYFGNVTEHVKNVVIQQNTIELSDEASANDRYFSVSEINFTADDVIVEDGKLGEITEKDVVISVKKSTDGDYQAYTNENKNTLFVAVGTYDVKYVVQYQANGQSKTVELVRSVSLEDATPPTITLSGTFGNVKEMQSKNESVMAFKATLGEIQIPAATATDDFDDGLSVSTQITLPSGTTETLSVPCTYECLETGVYTVVYQSTDVAGYETRKTATIEVRELWLTMVNPDDVPETVNIGESVSFANVKLLDYAEQEVQGDIQITYTYNDIPQSLTGTTITASKKGVYKIKLSATVGNESVETTYTVSAVDRNKPTISLNDTPPTSAKVGEQIILPKATCFDGEDGTLGCTVQAVFDGRTEQIYDYSLTVNVASVVQVIYTVTDYSGNSETISYQIVVTGGNVAATNTNDVSKKDDNVGLIVGVTVAVVAALTTALFFVIKKRKNGGK